MKTQELKDFLSENVIDSQKVLDKAYILLSDTMTSTQIQKKVMKIIKKSKTEKEAIKKVEDLKKNNDEEVEESISFNTKVKSYLGV